LGKKIYVGNLPFTATEAELRDAFGRHGNVASVAVITDRETGRPRGFAFVEMEEASSAADAIRALDGTNMGGRSIRVRFFGTGERSPVPSLAPGAAGL
jgi:RNA recognition motif-containing protein